MGISYKNPRYFLGTSFFEATDTKCTNRLDSINFLIKFVQTVVIFEEDQVIYGKEDFCSFPENTFALGLGDCEDKCKAFAFLIHHYFDQIDIIFLNYPGHIRIGLHDPVLAIENSPFQEYEGLRYLETELQDDRTVLGDERFAIFHSTPSFITK